MISCIIPCRNESVELISLVIRNLSDGIDKSDLEIIICNDGSCYPDGTFQSLAKDLSSLKEGRNIKFLDRKEQYGVGYSFDRGVEIASGDTIVLMGSDVFVQQRKWFYDVLHACRDKEIGNCCSVGLQPGQYDITLEGLNHRYGARLLYTLTIDDLPKSSELREDPDYRDILEAKWASKVQDEPYEISCLLGAFYWCKKSFYQEIRGFDTAEGKRFHGHAYYGALEPYLSLKTKVYNGKCVVYPDIKVGHVFNRVTMDNVFSKRAIRSDHKWWNKLFATHTMFEKDYRDELLAHPNFSMNLSQAQAWIKQNITTVNQVREYNKSHGKLISE